MLIRKGLFALFVGLLAIPVVAQANEFRKPYFMQHQPTIMGTVSSVSEHSFTVATDGGELMTFHIDSRSLMPSRLTPETRIMLEYALMENGDHRAVRVMPIGQGELPAATMEGDRPRAEWGAEGEPVAGAMGTEPASTSGDAETYGDDVVTTTGAYDDGIREEGAIAQNVDDDANATVADDQLPQTGSPWPFVQLAGGLAVVAGAGMLLFRRRRRA